MIRNAGQRNIAHTLTPHHTIPRSMWHDVTLCYTILQQAFIPHSITSYTLMLCFSTTSRNFKSLRHGPLPAGGSFVLLMAGYDQLLSITTVISCSCLNWTRFVVTSRHGSRCHYTWESIILLFNQITLIPLQ